MAHSPAYSSASSATSDDDAAPPQPAAAAVLQMVNVRSHVPIVLDFDASNYSQWRCCFDSVLGKFGLEDHVRSPTPLSQRNAEWRQVDSCLVNWIYTTIAANVFDLVHKPRITAFSLWSDVEGHFRDNELERAVLLEAEFRSVQQGDLSIQDYCTKLKRLADKLRDVGHPVSQPSQVLNLLRGLSPKFRHLKPVIKSKSPPHTFRSAMSYLLLEEATDIHDAKTDAAQAYLARQGGSASGGSSTGGSSAGASGGSSAGGYGGSGGGSRYKNKKKGRSSGPPTPGGGGGQHQQSTPSASWAANYAPWTGLVQAWSMPLRAPGSGVLGPRPPFQPQQAMAALHQPQLPSLPATSPTSASAWDNQALYTALNSAGVATQPPSASEWFLDTGASNHMSSSAGSSHQNGDSPM